MNKKKGILIVLSGPSGTGKGTVGKGMRGKNKNVYFSVSATTRKPRNNEVDGKDYYFMSRDEINDIINSGNMLEHAQYCGNIYGTPKKAIIDQLNNGKDVLLDIDVQGGAQVKEKMPDCISIFLLPPSLKVLEQRLRDRKTDSEENIKRRLKAAVKELDQVKNYDYLVVNDDLDSCVDDILHILNSEKLKTFRMIDILKGVVNNDDWTYYGRLKEK